MVATSEGTTSYQSTVQALAAQVSQGRQSLQSARTSLSRADNDVWQAGSNLSTADSYISQAQFDTPRTDSSWLGRAAEGPYRFSESSVEDAGFETPGAASSADDTAKALGDVADSLKTLAHDLSTQGDRFKKAADLAVAAQQAAGDGATEAGGAGHDSHEAGWRLSDGLNQLRMGESWLSQIELDRPGVDVGPYASMLESNVRSARYDLDDAGRSMRDAADSTDRADRHAADSEPLLTQLLTELQTLEQHR